MTSLIRPAEVPAQPDYLHQFPVTVKLHFKHQKPGISTPNSLSSSYVARILQELCFREVLEESSQVAQLLHGDCTVRDILNKERQLVDWHEL